MNSKYKGYLLINYLYLNIYNRKINHILFADLKEGEGGLSFYTAISEMGEGWQPLIVEDGFANSGCVA